jgi:hypothetical protein
MKTIRLTENELKKLVIKIINEQESNQIQGREFKILDGDTLQIYSPKLSKFVTIKLDPIAGNSVKLKNIVKNEDGYKFIGERNSQVIPNDEVKEILNFVDNTNVGEYVVKKAFIPILTLIKTNQK